jgi:hypothetical protein
MADAMVDQVRRFNRVVTERVGALNDHFLGRERPLGEARLLWEIGIEGCEVRLLRARLGLDSGYLNRMLRSLEATAGFGSRASRLLAVANVRPWTDARTSSPDRCSHR